MATRRHFGAVRKRSSGRWQATYWHEGCNHSAGTFGSKGDALAHLSTIEADLRRGTWINPKSGDVTVETYANQWLEQRHDLSVRTYDLYRYILDRHIFPSLGQSTLAALSPSKIRTWNSTLAKDHPATGAKAYRLLSTIMRTAVLDGVIMTSPCKVKGAGSERSPERPVATVAEIEALQAAMPAHLRLVVLLATWCQLRRGEILGLRRCDIDLIGSTITVEQSRTFRMNGDSIIKEPKSKASRRVLAVPKEMTGALSEHLSLFAKSDQDALIFIGRDGKPLSANALQGSWERARSSVNRSDLRLHDLRHTGLTLSAATGATTAELMHRAGHSSASAALRYQHATENRDRVLATALGQLIKPVSSH